jgi:RNA methyltransferase, TrmH family
MRPAEPITSRSHPLVKRLRALKERHVGKDLALVEGITLVEEVLAAGVEISEAAVTPRLRQTPRGRRVLRSLEAAGVVARDVAEGVMASLSDVEASQGVLALARRPQFAEDRIFQGTPLVLIAVQVQDPGNLGALFRTAEAAGASGAYLTRGTADAFSWKAVRGSMGSTFRLPHVAGLPVEEVLGRVEARGLSMVAAAGRGGERYDRVDFRGPLALIVGNEAAGLPESVLQAAGRTVTIPVRAPVESLNVAVAAGVLLFEAARQRESSARPQAQ